MKYITIGGTIRASAVAAGCMRLKGAQTGIDQIVGAELDNGINFFDHADIYGGGECERIFGDYLSRHKDIRDRIVIQTKCGIRSGFYDFSKEHITESLNGSLKRLKTDYADILLLHRPDTLMEPDEVAEAFSTLEREGKVKYFGVSNFSPAQVELLKTAVKQPLVVNQLQLSVTEAGMITSGLNVNMKNKESVMHDGSVLEYSRINKMTIQTWSPFQCGFIEKPFVGNYEEFPDVNAKLDELAEKYSAEPISVAAAWILRHPANMQIISGSTNPERIKAVCMGSDINLSREDWYSLYLSAGYRLP